MLEERGAAGGPMHLSSAPCHARVDEQEAASAAPPPSYQNWCRETGLSQHQPSASRESTLNKHTRVLGVSVRA